MKTAQKRRHKVEERDRRRTYMEQTIQSTFFRWPHFIFASARVCKKDQDNVPTSRQFISHIVSYHCTNKQSRKNGCVYAVRWIVRTELNRRFAIHYCAHMSWWIYMHSVQCESVASSDNNNKNIHLCCHNVHIWNFRTMRTTHAITIDTHIQWRNSESIRQQTHSANFDAQWIHP